jgi:hypothetical protein
VRTPHFLQRGQHFDFEPPQATAVTRVLTPIPRSRGRFPDDGTSMTPKYRDGSYCTFVARRQFSVPFPLHVLTRMARAGLDSPVSPLIFSDLSAKPLTDYLQSLSVPIRRMNGDCSDIERRLKKNARNAASCLWHHCRSGPFGQAESKVGSGQRLLTGTNCSQRNLLCQNRKRLTHPSRAYGCAYRR